MIIASYPVLKTLRSDDDKKASPKSTPIRKSEELTWEVMQQNQQELIALADGMKAVADEMKALKDKAIRETGLVTIMPEDPSPTPSTQSLTEIFEDYTSDMSSPTSSSSSLSSREFSDRHSE